MKQIIEQRPGEGEPHCRGQATTTKLTAGDSLCYARPPLCTNNGKIIAGELSIEGRTMLDGCDSLAEAPLNGNNDGGGRQL